MQRKIARANGTWRRTTKPQPGDSPEMRLRRDLFRAAERPKSEARNALIHRLGTLYRTLYGKIPRR